MSGETMQKCVQALKGAGCQVTFESAGVVRVVFSDGVVKEYSTTFFTLMVTKVIMEEAERIGKGGEV